MRQVTKVILSHKLTGTAAETSSGAVLAAGMPPPSLFLRFDVLVVHAAESGWDSGAAAPRAPGQQWLRWEQGPHCPPWHRVHPDLRQPTESRMPWLCC